MTSGVEDYILTATNAITKATPVSEGRCEFHYKMRAGEKCSRRVKFWVQRGPINQLVCGGHLAATVTEFHQIKPGRYGKSEHYEGYWISRTSTVIVKMKVGEGWR